MTNSAVSTLSVSVPDKELAPNRARRGGVLPDVAIRSLIESGELSAETPILPEQVQPASVDLRLGTIAYRVRASFLPGPDKSVKQKLDELASHEIDLREGAVLETGCVYIVPLLERLNVGSHLFISANPKSSTGRLDVFTRLICDNGSSFDTVPRAYNGRLYLEVSPKTFSILVRPGSRLNQLRFKSGSTVLSDAELVELHDRAPLSDREPTVRDGLAMRVDLLGLHNGLVGFRARRHTGVIDIDAKRSYDVADYWDPLFSRGRGDLVLDPNEFYILSSKENICVPATVAAEMVPFDPLMGEFRVHYAGFFDPGFGIAPGVSGSKAVLEVRSHEVPFLLEDGQLIGRLVYEGLSEEPHKTYGAGGASHYQSQGLKLSKHFRPFNLF